MEIVIQIAGSVLILVAFGLAQVGVLDVKSRRYLVLNFVGSAVLAVDAAVGAQWGFLNRPGFSSWGFPRLAVARWGDSRSAS
jgi:hypothetical protein